MSATRTSAAGQIQGIQKRMSLQKGPAEPAKGLQGVHVRVELNKALLDKRDNKTAVRLPSFLSLLPSPASNRAAATSRICRMAGFAPCLFWHCAPRACNHQSIILTHTYLVAIQKTGKAAQQTKPEGRTDRRGARTAKSDYGTKKTAIVPAENWRQRVQVLNKQALQGLGSYNHPLRDKYLIVTSHCCSSAAGSKEDRILDSQSPPEATRPKGARNRQFRVALVSLL